MADDREEEETTIRARRVTAKKLRVIAGHRDTSIADLIDQEFGEKVDRLYQKALQEMAGAGAKS